MTKPKIISLDTVSERDMDMLFANAFVTYPDFIQLFLKEAGITVDTVELSRVEISKTDAHLGESDITVTAVIDGKKYGFLIEDKIDAIAMPDQHSRYIKRAKKGIKNKEFDSYEIFIVCPQKYYDTDGEAKKYEHMVSYEKCMDYFNSFDTPDANVKSQQIAQAIDKSHRPPQVIINENANAFFRKYKQYQEENYEELYCRTKETSNGYWAHYRVKLKNAHIHHKIQQGNVDLTFSGAADLIDNIQSLVDWLKENGYVKIKATVIGNSAAIRIGVPVLDMQQPFETVDERDLKQCFVAITVLAEIASELENIRKIVI